jgi:NitT/TauT family transport system substrate-binding protein
MQSHGFLKGAGLIVVLGALAWLLTACDNSAEKDGATDKAGLSRVTFATDWKAQAEHGGFYQALALGLYEKHGLEVIIRQGSPCVNIPQLMAAGAVDFGIGSNSFIPLNIVEADAPVTAVMASFQKDPQVLLTHPRDDIKSLADMKGHPIMVSDATISAFWVWLRASFDFEDSQIRKYTFNLAPFLVDPSAIQQGYVTSEPYSIAQEGSVSPQVFLLSDYGYPGYATFILASNKAIEETPEQVRAFVEASIEGWYSYLYGDPGPGNALIKKDNPEISNAHISQAIEKMKAYGIADSGDSLSLGIGAMTDARWKSFFDVMSESGVYPTDLDYQKAYTLEFINAGHGMEFKTQQDTNGQMAE